MFLLASAERRAPVLPCKGARLYAVKCSVLHFYTLQDEIANVSRAIFRLGSVEGDERDMSYSICRIAVSYTHLRAHETRHDLVCRLLLEKKKKNKQTSSH